MDAEATTKLTPLVGWAEVALLYGDNTRFHDAEIIGVSFADLTSGRMDIHFWRTTTEVDQRGNFIRNDHAVVSVIFGGIREIRLRDMDFRQNVISSLTIHQIGKGGQVEWDSSVGVNGLITASDIRFEISMGMPNE